MKRLAIVTALILLFAACEGPIGPAGEQGTQGEQGIQGEQGPAGDDAYTEVVRVRGHLDMDGAAAWTLAHRDVSPDHMPLVNVWVRATMNDPYRLVATSEAPGEYAVVYVDYDSGTEQYIIGIYLPDCAGLEYVMVVMFYSESPPPSRPTA